MERIPSDEERLLSLRELGGFALGLMKIQALLRRRKRRIRFLARP